MNGQQFLDNPNYRESCTFIVEGHALIAQGRSTMPQSDEELDRMESAWYELNSSESERLRGLSADLYMLLGQERLAQLDPTENTIATLGTRLKNAVADGKWDEVLALLRFGPSFLSQAQIALLRGHAWMKLGHDDVALLFFDFALRKLKARQC